MENVDDFDRVATYSIHDAVGCLHQLANIRPFIPVNGTAEPWEFAQLVTTFQNPIDRMVRGVL